MPSEKKRAPVLLPPGAGRAYAMGPVHAVFKADGEETRGRYSISEWWLEPYTRGPGAHTHEEDDVFFVIEELGDLSSERRVVSKVAERYSIPWLEIAARAAASAGVAGRALTVRHHPPFRPLGAMRRQRSRPVSLIMG